MILVSAFKKYFALDAKQKEFIKSGQRIFLAKPSEILKILQPLASFDKDCDAARSQCGWFMFFCFLAGFLVLMLNASETINIPMFEGVIFFFVALFVLLLVAYMILKSVDIHNNLREFVVPVLNTISQDMDPNEKIRVKVDLRGKCIPAKRTRQENNDPGWFSYPKVTRFFYRDNWLDGSATLCDGSKLFFSVTDLVTNTIRKKKNPRGKVKTKSKYKVKSRIKVGLALKNKNYQIQQTDALTAAGDRVKQKQGSKRNVISLTRVEIFNSLEAALEPISLLSLVGKILMSAKPAAKQEQ